MSDVLAERLSGIQLALFELIWPAFDWIEAIYVGAEPGLCLAYVQVNRPPSQAEEDDCKRLLGEIFDAALAGTSMRLKVVQGKQRPLAAGYQEAISGEIFKMIAKEVAPWRLDAGR